jgi:DNA-binding transcriptional LysR family regulator
MRITHLRQADLNLLVVFTALAEERNVTRAASRLLLSQPAVSRALQRLREMFHDDLLIRTSSGYEPTPKGKRLLQELSAMLPRLDRLLSGEDFDPIVEEATFRIAVTDHASHVLCPLICRKVLPTRPSIERHLNPIRHRNRAHATVFPNEVDDAPAAIALLHVCERECRHLRAPQPTAE